MAAMIAAGGASSTQDPALLEALKEAALDPSVKVRLEKVKKLFSEGKPVEAAALLSEINERPCMAAVYYKAGEVKHVQGSSVVPGANAVVVHKHISSGRCMLGAMILGLNAPRTTSAKRWD